MAAERILIEFDVEFDKLISEQKDKKNEGNSGDNSKKNLNKIREHGIITKFCLSIIYEALN